MPRRSPSTFLALICLLAAVGPARAARNRACPIQAERGRDAAEPAGVASAPSLPVEPVERLAEALRRGALSPFDVLALAGECADVLVAGELRRAREGWYEVVLPAGAERKPPGVDPRVRITGAASFAEEAAGVVMFEMELEEARFGVGDEGLADGGSTLVSCYVTFEGGRLAEASALADARGAHTPELERALRERKGEALLRGASYRWMRGEEPGAGTATWQPFWISLVEDGEAPALATSLGDKRTLELQLDDRDRREIARFERELLRSAKELVNKL